MRDHATAGSLNPSLQDLQLQTEPSIFFPPTIHYDLARLSRIFPFSDTLKRDPFFLKLIQDQHLSATLLSPKQEEETLCQMLREIDTHQFNRAGAQKYSTWNTGWSENLELFRAQPVYESLLPKFFKPILLREGVRVGQQQFVLPTKDVMNTFRYQIWHLMQYWILKDWIEPYGTDVHEFGCGTFYNLVQWKQWNQNLKVTGYEWVPSAIELGRLIKDKLLINVHPCLFDLTNPNRSYRIDKKSIVFTSGALEQIGTNYQAFVNFLIHKNPRLIIHFEPIEEFLDPDHNMIDYVAARYLKERNYLSGYLRYLQYHPQVQIIKTYRMPLAHQYAPHWDLVVWKKK